MNTVRYRKSESMVRSGISRFESVVGDSVLKVKMMPSRAKFLFFLSGVLSLAFYLYLASWVFSGDLPGELERLLETEKCPACFGGSGCGMLYHRHVELSGASRFRSLDLINGRNIYYGSMRPHGRQVVIKKLAADRRIQALDEKLCQEARRPANCDLARVIPRTDKVLPFMKDPLLPKHLNQTGASMFRCPSYRLLDRLWTKFQERKRQFDIFLSDKIQVFYSALVNPEALMLQVFPKPEGWPFPEYLGACGRTVIVEHVGEPLSSFVEASFQIRAGIAYELMKIAETLSTKSDFALYLGEVNLGNFAVDSSGKVTVVDLENIIVVDRLSLEARKPRGYADPHQAITADCASGENCVILEPSVLCSHTHSDHNYLAVCRNILSPMATEFGMSRGFLHGMPVEADEVWDLTTLLNECTNPGHMQGRWKVKSKLITALKAIRDAEFEREGKPVEKPA